MTPGTTVDGGCSAGPSVPVIALVLALVLCVAGGLRESAGQGADTTRERLLVQGTMDRPAMAPIIAGFLERNPGTAVDYQELNSIKLHDAFVKAATAGEVTADLVMSSAIDLQMKLVNDGHALAHRSSQADAIPAWAIWRDEAFAYSYEPVVMVYNAALLSTDRRPTNRYRLVELMRAEPTLFHRRVGTYDPAISGTGYLYVTQDMENSPIIWELIRTLGQVGARLYPASSQIIDAVVSGELLVGYNVVGSYAYARAAVEPDLRVVAPEDYTLAVARTAFISRHGRAPALARRFLEFLLSRDGQSIVANRSGLFPIRADVADASMANLAREAFGGVRPVQMSPGLLVYVDRMKRQKVLRRWRDAMLSGAPSP